MDTTLSLISPAKLNLFLHINGRKPDGYHELQTLFQLLDRGDILHFENRPNKEITVSANIDDIPLEDNLIYRAAKILQAKSKTLYGAHIKLEKNLSLGGGVGGGSSNAATTFLALNKLWGLDLSQQELAELGLSLGADIPVFIYGRSAWAEGIGERLTPVDLPENWYVVICPKIQVSTAQIFSHERLTRESPKMRIAPALGAHDMDAYRNDCQAIVTELYPEVGHAIEWLNQYGSGRLTGTGACCFCRVDSEANAQNILNEAGSKFCGFIAKGVNISPTIQRLNEVD